MPLTSRPDQGIAQKVDATARPVDSSNPQALTPSEQYAQRFVSQGSLDHGHIDSTHGSMDHGSMDHGSMDHGSMDHGAMGHGGISHGGMNHGGMNHGGMDHGGMDHGGMDHGGMDHGGMDHGGSGSMCSMNMVWNTDPNGLCLVFQSWRITSTTSLYTSLFAIVLLGVFYEWLRLQLRNFDRRIMASSKRHPARRNRRGGRRVTPGAASGSTHRRVASANHKGILISSLNAGEVLPSSRRAPGLSSSGEANSASGAESDSPFLTSRSADGGSKLATDQSRRHRLMSIPPLGIPRSLQMLRSLGYAASVSLSFFLMLLFMTYNAWVIGAVVVGAALGHYLFQRPSTASDEADSSELDDEDDDDFKGMACH